MSKWHIISKASVLHITSKASYNIKIMHTLKLLMEYRILFTDVYYTLYTVQKKLLAG